MKIKIGILRLLILTCGIFAMTAVFAQTTYVWTNQNPGHLGGITTGDMNQATNWSPNGVPNPMTGPDANGAYGDLLLFDGRTTGPLSVTENGGTLAGFGGASYPAGARIELTSAQTNPVTIFSAVSISGGLRMNYFLIDADSGGLILGDHSVNVLDIIAGEINGQRFGFTNNSSTPSVVNESVRWRQGGAGAHPYVFAGMGDWIVNNHMRSAGSSAILVQKFGPGTMTWIGTNNSPMARDWFDQLGTPITIGGGTMIWKTSDLVGGSAGNPNIVHNGVLFKYDVSPTPGLVTEPGIIAGNISGTGALEMSNGTLTLSGTNTYSGGTLISGGTLQVGTNGASGSLGSGGVTNNSMLVFNRAGTLAVGTVTGTGSITNLGTGTVTLTGTSSLGGDVDLKAGTFGAAPSATIGSLTVGGNLTIASNVTILAAVNRSLSPSNSVYTVAGLINHTNGGTLKLINTGPLPQVGDTFTIFSQPVTNMTIVSPGFTVQNNLGVDGSVMVSAVAPLPTITTTVSGAGGTTLNLSWPANWTGGVHLQAQTNGINKGLSTNWVTIPGSDAGNSYMTTLNKTNGSVFYRLAP